MTDYEKALVKAKEEDKPLLLNFTGYRDGGAEEYVEHLKDMISPHMELATGESEPEPETSKYRTWTSQSGSTVDAALVEHGGGTIKLRKPDGSMFQIKVGLLSQGDREFLEKR